MVAAFAGGTAYLPGWGIKPYRSLIEVVAALLDGAAYVPYQGIKPYSWYFLRCMAFQDRNSGTLLITFLNL